MNRSRTDIGYSAGSLPQCESVQYGSARHRQEPLVTSSLERHGEGPATGLHLLQLSGSTLGAEPAGAAGSALGSFGSLGSLAAFSFLATGAEEWVICTSFLSSTATTMVSPALYLKRRSSSESGSSIRRWITRRS